MKKSKKLLNKSIFLLILIILVSGIIFYQKSSEKDNLDEETFIEKLNERCSPTTFCAPFYDICHDWRATSYVPYKSCISPIENIEERIKKISSCKKIERKDLAAYCISLLTKEDPSREECLNFANGDKKLNAICHITKEGQLVYQNWDNNKYYILEDCPGGQSKNYYGTGCETLVWQEDEEATIYPKPYNSQYNLPTKE